MANRLAFISKVLYRLKRRYGASVDILRRTSSVVDRETGLKTVQTRLIRLRRVIVLPAQLAREFSYDLAYIAAAKNFTYGGFFDTTERRFIVDTKDLPTDFEIEIGDYFVYDQVRYDVKTSERFEDARAFFVQAKQSIASDLDNEIMIEIVDELSLTSEAEAEIQ